MPPHHETANRVDTPKTAGEAWGGRIQDVEEQRERKERWNAGMEMRVCQTGWVSKAATSQIQPVGATNGCRSPALSCKRRGKVWAWGTGVEPSQASLTALGAGEHFWLFTAILHALSVSGASWAGVAPP